MFSFQGVSLCPKKPEPKAKAKGNDLKPRGKVSACGSTCDAKQEAEKGIAGKLSTKVRREAWKQAERKGVSEGDERNRSAP